MGREATITYEQVAAAADAMKVAGGKPTSRGIRERLGNTGSMGTVNKLLQAWKAAQERQVSAALSLPPVLQRAILDFMGQELSQAKAALEAELAEQQQEAADLAAENERQGADIEDKNDAAVALQANLATLQGRLNQIEIDLGTARNDALREREAAEAARIELAKALLRLEAMPRLEADIDALRVELDKERQGRVAAEQQAAVLGAKLEGANERTGKAEAATIEAVAQARKHGEAVFAEAAKVEAAKNTISNLTGKLEAMQAQIERQAGELDAARQGAAKAGGDAAELRGKPATKPPKAPSKE